MEILSELLPGCFLVGSDCFDDHRGSFVKTFHSYRFSEFNFSFEIREEYYTTSAKGVIRGMHFQVPPSDHQKIVYCISGWVKDVLLDLRKGPGYGKVCFVDLRADLHNLILIPKGIAHGFLSKTQNSTMVYKTSTVHDPKNDRGILWNSFGFDWDVTESPIFSIRDSSHPRFEDFISPF